jgi:hypothetical protein
VGTALIALSVIIVVSQFAMYGRGSGETFPTLSSDKFIAYILGKVAAVFLPLALGIYLLRKRSTESDMAEEEARPDARNREAAPVQPSLDSSSARTPIQPSRDSSSARSARVDTDNIDPWEDIIEHFPDLAIYHELLVKADAAYAASYKSKRIAARDFSKAQEQYWATINDLLSEVCGQHGGCRNFLLHAINNRDFQTARRFIALGRALGAENMNSNVLEKFRQSNS